VKDYGSERAEKTKKKDKKLWIDIAEKASKRSRDKELNGNNPK